MKGIASEKYHALEHRYPSRIEWLDKFGYDPKQLHHLIRINAFMLRYLGGTPFEECLISKDPEFLVEVKKGKYSLEEASINADATMNYIQMMYDNYMKTCDNTIDETIYKLFEEVIYDTIKIGITKELEINK
jgi:hypothetical protein